jgi:phosphoserine phosphatase
MPKYKLVCFDVDGTLVDNVEFSWQIFHDYFKVDQVRRENAKKAFYNNEISYLEWAEHDINMWVEKNATKDDFLDAIKNLKLMEGALETIRELKKRNIKLGIISGSLNIILEKVLPNYKETFNDVFLSRIYFDKNRKINRVEATEFDMIHKATALKNIAKRENIKLSECVFVGDHENDVKVAQIAGLGIAFNCKSENLRKVADVVIDKKDLREILKYVL